MGIVLLATITRPERAGSGHFDQPDQRPRHGQSPDLERPRSPSSSTCEHRAHCAAMLAPYPDRLRSSRSTAAQSNANANSASPTPPPSHVPPSTSTSQHRLFSSRSNLPLTRMRTNSLSSPSPSHHADSSSASSDHVSPRSSRNSSRRPGLHRRPSTSSGIPDQKHQPPVPITSTSPSASPIPVSSLYL